MNDNLPNAEDTENDASDISSVDNNQTHNVNDLSSLLHSYFSSHSFTLPPIAPYDLLTIACHNVRGLNDPVKQSQLLNLVIDKNISILGLSETRLSPSNSAHLYKGHTLFQSFWSTHPTRQISGGVGLIVKAPYTRH